MGDSERKKNKMSTKRIAFLGLFLAFAMILSYVESLIPFYFGVPGMKLGLPNAAILMVLYIFGPLEALIVNVIRVILTGLMFTNIFSIMFSLFGAVFSFVGMWLIKKFLRPSIQVVSVFGGLLHNIGQLIVAILIVKNYLVGYYLPVLLIAGFVTGLLIGIISAEVLKRLQPLIINTFAG